MAKRLEVLLLLLSLFSTFTFSKHFLVDVDENGADYKSVDDEVEDVWKWSGNGGKSLMWGWDGISVPVHIPEALSGKTKITVSDSEGLILDLVNPSKTQWQEGSIEMDGEVVPLKINGGVLNFKLMRDKGVFLSEGEGQLE